MRQIEVIKFAVMVKTELIWKNEQVQIVSQIKIKWHQYESIILTLWDYISKVLTSQNPGQEFIITTELLYIPTKQNNEVFQSQN